MKDILDRKLEKTYYLATDYLKRTVGPDKFEREMQYYKTYRPKNLNDVFKRMIVTLQNKQGYVNFIGIDLVDEMSEILFDFDSRLVSEYYGNDYEKLFLKFQKKFPNKKFDINNKRNAWVMYAKGVLSCANFLKTFDNLSEFDRFVNSFNLNEYTIAALPMLLEKEIFGFGFPLSCDFLKEIGYTNYGKPDIHLKDIFGGLELVSTTSDYEIFKTIVKIAKLTGQDAVIVDKVFLIIGSGKLEVCGGSIGRQKKQFMEFAAPILLAVV